MISVEPSGGGEIMSKKVLFIISVMFVTLILSTTAVNAGMGNNKLSYEARIQLAGFNSIETSYAPPTGTPRVQFRTLSEPLVPTSFVLAIGGIEYYPNLDAVELILVRHYQVDFRTIKSTETYSFEGIDGTIVVSVIGKTINLSGDRQEMANLVGHGTGYFEDVIITGTGTDEGGVKVHTGTIMGWPGLPT